MTIDLQTVTLQGTYRIGFQPPAERSLSAGELYIEVGAGLPKLWVGTMTEAGLTGDMAVFATAAAAPAVPPVNRDVPFIMQEGDKVTCTMGNWDGAPTDYAYQWKLDGVDTGDGTAAYTTTPADIGKTATCVVSATNSAGTTAAPPSNPVLIAPPAQQLTASGTPVIAEAEVQGPPMPPQQAAPTPEAKPEAKAEDEHRSRRGH